jgi:hypothetical protein
VLQHMACCRVRTVTVVNQLIKIKQKWLSEYDLSQVNASYWLEKTNGRIFIFD